ncbi:hypothetical protein DPE44_02365 [Salmonella enterica subsp. salamae]|nr:hypothetical protein [Salmonella enterica subsp. salamae]ECD9407785.1 hypothetical protein [Salmonella enterica subsp. salamae]EDU0565121.1 hypothetical protein [Salmonella enterica subsp. salamae]
MVENRGGLPYRINWSAGLRVYLIQDGDEIVILLCAGFKDRQNESFNIIYIMRTSDKDGRIWRESLTLAVNWLLSTVIQNHPFLQTNQNQMSVSSK